MKSVLAFCVVVICVVIICIPAAVSGALRAAPGKSDFSGTWQLDSAMSRFDKDFPAPKSMKLIIEHHEPKLRVELKSETKHGPQDLVFDLTTDGTEVKGSNSGSTDTATAEWGDVDGTRLVLTIKQQSPNGVVETSRIMKLGSTGKMLTTVLTVENQGHEENAYEFFSRKE